MRKMELRRKRKAERDDVREGNRHSMAGLDAESTSVSANFRDRAMVEEGSKRRKDSKQC